ncbi:MAG TPA: phosphomannomutase/phosphoglucomutase [Patescibacteria group bacterium]|nr:phosphomannomutase/phosphoglucomutase [Patescibacteria group bacterium]
MINPKIFKAYDIRGVVPTDLNEEIAERVGRAFVTFVLKKQSESGKITKRAVVVSRDARTSSPAFFTALARGINDMGWDVVDVGQSSTDMFYFACGMLQLPGIAVTASHNPKEYNGFKMIHQMPFAVGGGFGMEEIKERVMSDAQPEPNAVKGKIIQQDIRQDFIKKVLSFIDTTKVQPLKVVIDCGNGMAGPYVVELAKVLPIKIVPMYFEPDGTFPNHPADPLEKANRAELEKRVVTEKADLGIAFDGDVDRCFFVDEKGQFVSGDFLTALLAQSFLKKFPKNKVIYDIRSSDATPDTIKKNGGTPLVNRVGHAYIKRRMIEDGAVFAGEVTGHYYFKDFFYADSGLVPAMLILEMLSTSGKSMSELLRPFTDNYFISGEINSRVGDIPLILKKLEEIYKDGQMDKMDGISIRYPDWHFNVRASNTEPLIRLNLEAKTKQMMEQKRDEVLKIIRG